MLSGVATDERVPLAWCANPHDMSCQQRGIAASHGGLIRGLLHVQAAEERSLQRLAVVALLALALGEVPGSDALFQRSKAPAGPQPHLPVTEYQVNAMRSSSQMRACAGTPRATLPEQPIHLRLHSALLIQFYYLSQCSTGIAL